MKNKLIPISIITALMFLLSSCSAIASIFKAGMNVGIFFVVFIIVIIVALILRARSRK